MKKLGSNEIKGNRGRERAREMAREGSVGIIDVDNLTQFLKDNLNLDC